MQVFAFLTLSLSYKKYIYSIEYSFNKNGRKGSILFQKNFIKKNIFQLFYSRSFMNKGEIVNVIYALILIIIINMKMVLHIFVRQRLIGNANHGVINN